MKQAPLVLPGKATKAATAHICFPTSAVAAVAVQAQLALLTHRFNAAVVRVAMVLRRLLLAFLHTTAAVARAVVTAAQSLTRLRVDLAAVVALVRPSLVVTAPLILAAAVAVAPMLAAAPATAVVLAVRAS